MTKPTSKTTQTAKILSDLIPVTPNEKFVGWTVNFSNENGIDGYDGSYLAASDQADQFWSKGGKALPDLDKQGSTTIRVLPELIGKPWNNGALNLVYGLRPSSVRVTHGEVYCDAHNWRVTIVVDEKTGTIAEITQEVVIGLAGCRFGHDMTTFMRGLEPHPLVNGCLNFYNVRGLKKLDLYSGSDNPELNALLADLEGMQVLDRYLDPSMQLHVVLRRQRIKNDGSLAAYLDKLLAPVEGIETVMPVDAILRKMRDVLRDTKTTSIQAPLPAGVEDTPEVRAQMQALVESGTK